MTEKGRPGTLVDKVPSFRGEGSEAVMVAESRVELERRRGELDGAVRRLHVAEARPPARDAGPRREAADREPLRRLGVEVAVVHVEVKRAAAKRDGAEPLQGSPKLCHLAEGRSELHQMVARQCPGRHAPRLAGSKTGSSRLAPRRAGTDTRPARGCSRRRLARASRAGWPAYQADVVLVPAQERLRPPAFGAARAR